MNSEAKVMLLALLYDVFLLAFCLVPCFLYERLSQAYYARSRVVG